MLPKPSLRSSIPLFPPYEFVKVKSLSPFPTQWEVNWVPSLEMRSVKEFVVCLKPAHPQHIFFHISPGSKFMDWIFPLVLGFELRGTLLPTYRQAPAPTTVPQGLTKLLRLNSDLLSSKHCWDYSCEPQCQAWGIDF